MTNFKELGLVPSILQTLSNLGFETPTPIQKEAIPLVLEGNDLMGLAQTGTGKTAAFGLPIVQRLSREDERAKPKHARTLILAPTRELVNQIAQNIRQYVKRSHLKVCVVIGGQSINTQARNMHRGCDILVATPGRLLDLTDRNAVILGETRYLVLDEADQMLDLGFIHSLRKIARLLNQPRQTLLFSATMPKQVEELSKAFLRDPVRVEVSPPGRAADKIQQMVHFVEPRAKVELLKDCLIEREDDLSLIFTRTKHGAEKLMKHLDVCGFKVNSIHGNKSQGQRDRALQAFRSGAIRILVATDVAARGIDIPGVSHVYNYDLPEVPENYVHRIGRTARAGADGKAIAFCTAEQVKLLNAIEKLMGFSIQVASGEKPAPVSKAKKGGDAKPARVRRRNVKKTKRHPGGAGKPPASPAKSNAQGKRRRKKSRKPVAA